MKALSIAALALIATAAPLQAATDYDLAGDFSNAANPNGPWSFVYGGSALAHQTPLANGNHLVPVLADGYWSTGNDLNLNTPDVMKVTGPGTSGGETLEDFLTGDVILHSPNAGDALLIIWTAPADGTIDLSGSAWYAHSLVDRSNDFVVRLNGGASLFSGVIDDSILRSTALIYGASGLAVSAGDELSFAFSKTAGQTYGSLNGLAVRIAFTATAPIPEPASWTMMIGGLAFVGGTMRRQRVALRFA